VVEDLRGRFESNVEMYTWAYQTLWPQCNHDILAYIDTIFPTLRDYLVAQKIFVLGLDPHRADEVALLDTIYRETPMNISVLGWVVDEVIGVRLLSRNGKFHNPSDLVPNVSVHAGLAPKEFEPIERPDPPPLENRIYVAFAITDGSNLSFIHREMLNQWEDPARGSIPLGWELNTTLQDLSPATYHYYRSTATENDHFIGPPSGIGYMYPVLYPDFPGFLDLTRRAFERHDYYTIWPINDDLTLPDSIATAYSAALDIEGIFVDYWPNGDRPWHLASDGTPMVHSRYVYLVGAEQLEKILASAAVEKQYHYLDEATFVYLNVNGWGTPPSLIAGIVEGLDDRYRVVRPDHMLLLIGEALR